MYRTIRLPIILSAAFALSGCLAAVTVDTEKKADYGLSKTVQFAAGGSMEVALDDSKLTAEQKSALKQLRSVAIWPAPNLEAAALGQTLSEGSTLQVVSPSRVSSIMKQRRSQNDPGRPAAGDMKSLLERVSEDTGVEAVLYLASGKGEMGVNAPSLDEVNHAQEFGVMIYGSSQNSLIAMLPARVKTDFGAKTADAAEVRKALGAEVGKIVIALTDNLERGRVVSYSATSAAPVQPASPVPSGNPIADQRTVRQGTDRALSVKEVQVRLNELGFNVGRADGVFGPRSVAGLRKFQQSSGIPVTGKLGSETVKKLRGR